MKTEITRFGETDTTSIETEDDQCGNCRYWKQIESIHGYCRRYPPMIGQESPALYVNAQFPIMQANDWCGEWRKHEHG